MKLIKQSQWAKKHGFSRQYVSQLVKSGVIELINGLVDVEQADATLESNKELSTLLLKIRIKNETERGKLLEARVKAEIGALISVEDVKVAAFKKGRMVRDSLMNIPDRLSSLLASIDDSNKIHEILSKEIKTALEELSRDSLPDKF